MKWNAHRSFARDDVNAAFEMQFTISLWDPGFYRMKPIGRVCNSLLVSILTRRAVRLYLNPGPLEMED